MALDHDGEREMRKVAINAEYLDLETEQTLARKWRDEQCEVSLHRLIKAYMRLAVSMANRYRRYGVSQTDLVQEASLGLMRAAEKFDPDRGVRFSTYAVWWIKASIQDFVMRNWSLVRTGSTSTQKSLFFNLRRVRANIEREASKSNEVIDRERLHQEIAEQIGVPIRDVKMMDGRMSGSDYSLNAVQASDEDGREWIDTIADDSDLVEDQVATSHDNAKLSDWLVQAMSALSDREKMILTERKLRDEPKTLETIGTELGLSKERVRQLEVAALKKMRAYLTTNVGGEVRQLVNS